MRSVEFRIGRKTRIRFFEKFVHFSRNCPGFALFRRPVLGQLYDSGQCSFIVAKTVRTTTTLALVLWKGRGSLCFAFCDLYDVYNLNHTRHIVNFFIIDCIIYNKSRRFFFTNLTTIIPIRLFIIKKRVFKNVLSRLIGNCVCSRRVGL